MAADGQSVRGLIRSPRLQALHRELCDPRLSEHSIGALAVKRCFTDASYLNHHFHATYGMAPSDVRRRSSRGPRLPRLIRANIAELKSSSQLGQRGSLLLI
ncbi:hypothetical protein RW1_067_00070 [Rhodococcus wratislaviensis NBRC 100605]|uniref:HTH araC/xylS-type domain-containing protein n=2 Tax=Rhodococcus wratislaviensis TaxID=44752 RepID=X0PZQ7_RHOWR|nr:hypothetical protein RW1_067_00070 [Rhodococcus wratislaviensis NBRC 100605]